MAYKQIEIPGGTTVYEDVPQVSISGGSNHPLTLTIQYNAKRHDGTTQRTTGVIKFEEVLEYSWVESEFYYEGHPEHNDDLTFGLIEIVDSQYIEEMANKGRWRDLPGRRFGYVLDESKVRHFRLMFDDYGRFDVMALAISIEEIQWTI